MELIQWMVSQDSPLIAWTQQGVEAAAPSVGNHRASPLLVTDRTNGQNEPEVKQHHQPTAIGVWLTMTCVSG
jgi:hypothetical protein